MRRSIRPQTDAHECLDDVCIARIVIGALRRPDTEVPLQTARRRRQLAPDRRHRRATRSRVPAGQRRGITPSVPACPRNSSLSRYSFGPTSSAVRNCTTSQSPADPNRRAATFAPFRTSASLRLCKPSGRHANANGCAHPEPRLASRQTDPATSRTPPAAPARGRAHSHSPRSPRKLRQVPPTGLRTPQHTAQPDPRCPSARADRGTATSTGVWAAMSLGRSAAIWRPGPAPVYPRLDPDRADRAMPRLLDPVDPEQPARPPVPRTATRSPGVTAKPRRRQGARQAVPRDSPFAQRPLRDRLRLAFGKHDRNGRLLAARLRRLRRQRLDRARLVVHVRPDESDRHPLRRLRRREIASARPPARGPGPRRLSDAISPTTAPPRLAKTSALAHREAVEGIGQHQRLQALPPGLDRLDQVPRQRRRRAAHIDRRQPGARRRSPPPPRPATPCSRGRSASARARSWRRRPTSRCRSGKSGHGRASHAQTCARDMSTIRPAIDVRKWVVRRRRSNARTSPEGSDTG